MAYESFHGEPDLYLYRGIKIRFDFKMLGTGEVEEARAWIADDEDLEELLLMRQGLWQNKKKAYSFILDEARHAIDKSQG